MKNFDITFTDIKKLPKQKPDFNNLLKVLKREKPDRFTLFEFAMNNRLQLLLTGRDTYPEDTDEIGKLLMKAFEVAGYDYVSMHASKFYFPHNDNNHNQKSVSVNEGATIVDRETFEQYKWPDPVAMYDGKIERLSAFLPEGMKIIIHSPGGLLENVTFLTGYDNLCYLLADDEDLLQEIFDNVGQRLYDYYKCIINNDSVGAIMSNDDWGFYSQTMLSTENMRKYVFPWHKKIVQLAHDAGKPVILHSCGNLGAVYGDIINDMQFDAKHSYEDKIQPVEQAYKEFSGKLAVMGGIDMDFVCRAEPEQIYKRCCDMLETTQCKGYALGTGNSVPSYMPVEHYFAMTSAVLQNR